MNVHTVQAHLRFLKWMRRILHQKIQPSESISSDTKRPALERHTYEEGHTNAEKQSKYRSTKKAKNRGSFPSFNFGCM